MRYGVVYIEPILENPCPLVPPHRMWSTGQSAEIESGLAPDKELILPSRCRLIREANSPAQWQSLLQKRCMMRVE
jgi:hypothetical protein